MTGPVVDPALEAALDELFAAPFPEFVDERKRLVVGLRAAGSKAAAAALAKVNRPTLASWAINQLVRRAPAEVSAMFATAARVRLGDFAASAEHRQTIGKLSALATELLREHAQPTSEATLRRITTSLQALSAYGDFAPDVPGRMVADRDPPGFDAMVLGEGSAGAALPLTLPGVVATASTPASAVSRAAPSPATPAKIAVAPAASPKAARSPAAPSPAANRASAAAAAEPPAPPRPTGPMLRLVPPLPAEDPADVAARNAKAAEDAKAAEAAADAEAAEAAAQAERAVAEAAAALAAAQAAARAAAARVHLQRQRAVLEELRTRQRRAATSIYDHEQAILLMQRELEQRQALLRTARHDAETLQTEIDRIAAELEQLGAKG